LPTFVTVPDAEKPTPSVTVATPVTLICCRSGWGTTTTTALADERQLLISLASATFLRSSAQARR